MKIAPSLLACDLANLEKEVRAIETAGADVVHLDVMDGHFVPNLTFGLPVIEKLRPHTKLPFDAHLMVENADGFIEDFAKAGCNWLSVHVEACPHLNRTIRRIKELGVRAGVAINPGTALSALDGILTEADFFLIMSVNPGFGGQKFIENSFERVSLLRKKLGPSSQEIEIDGGIKESNAAAAVKAGCDILVVGTGFFSSKDYKATVQKLRAAGK